MKEGGPQQSRKVEQESIPADPIAEEVASTLEGLLAKAPKVEPLSDTIPESEQSDDGNLTPAQREVLGETVHSVLEKE